MPSRFTKKKEPPPVLMRFSKLPSGLFVLIDFLTMAS